MSEDSFELELKNIDSVNTMCKKLMQTKHYQKLGEEGIFALLMKAKSLNLNPIDALSGLLYFVQGKVGMSSEMMASLIREQGHSIIKDPKSDNSICILHGKRKDNGDTWTCSFGIEDARKAGLLKNMYEKYPGVMLYNRAMSMLARQLFPDVIKGAGYTMDELKEIARSQPLQEAEVEKINQDQVDALKEVYSRCDEEFKKSQWDFFKRAFGISKIEDIPAHEFDKIMSDGLKNEKERRDREIKEALSATIEVEEVEE